MNIREAIDKMVNHTDLSEAARNSAAGAVQHGDGVRLTTSCPSGGHCRVAAELRLGGRVIARTRFQQTPDTFDRFWLTPDSPAARRALREGAEAGVTVRETR